MTTSSPKNYNVVALRGDKNMTDMEYVETFGLDPAVANTPKINDAMLDIAMQDNIQAGMDEKKAMRIRSEHARGIAKLIE